MTYIKDIFSIGYSCENDYFLKDINMRQYSSPFSYMIIDIETAIHFINTEFKGYLDVITPSRIPPYKLDEKILTTNFFMNKAFIDDKTIIEDWDRVCLWIHHDINSPDIVAALNRRSKHLMTTIREHPESTLFTYLDKPRDYLEHYKYFNLDLLREFTDKYKCQLLILIPFNNMFMKPYIAINTERVKVIYFMKYVFGPINTLIHTFYEINIDEGGLEDKNTW